jgi:hypothetical protein
MDGYTEISVSENRVTFVNIERSGTYGQASVQVRDDSSAGRFVRSKKVSEIERLKREVGSLTGDPSDRFRAHPSPPRGDSEGSPERHRAPDLSRRH